MGRPLNKRFFGNPTGDGKQLRLTEAYIPGASGPTANAHILRQTGTSRYLVTDGTDRGIIYLVAGGGALKAGEARMAVSAYDGEGVEYARQIHSRTVKTYEGNMYGWGKTPASALRHADLPMA